MAAEPTGPPAERQRTEATTLLVVDPDPRDRQRAGETAARTLGWRILYADHGRTALAMLERENPDVVATALRMPEMSGLELVTAARRRDPLIPVVLLTGQGDEEVAQRALNKGAASYVPKAILDRDLAPTLELVLSAAHMERRQQRLLGQLTAAELHFSLENDPRLIPDLVAHLQQYLVRLGLCALADKTRVGVALEEALLNAMYHGNLEVSSDLRQNGEEPYHRLAQERRQLSPYRERQVHVTASFSRREAVYVIRDEGPGFEVEKLPDPTDPNNWEKASGRGILLMRTFLDDVRHEERGTKVTLIKRRDQPES